MQETHKNYDTTLPQLVSYPRTGSHWLRMILEGYFGKYCLPTSFLDSTISWGYHLHDRIVGEGEEGITGDFDKVIYLYRNPVDTVYSFLLYLYGDLRTEDFRVYHSRLDSLCLEYSNHLKRWLNNNSDIKEMIFVKYEDLQDNPLDTLKKVLSFLDEPIDEKRLKEASCKITLENAKKILIDSGSRDHRIISVFRSEEGYKYHKEQFKKNYGNYIMSKFEGLWR